MLVFDRSMRGRGSGVASPCYNFAWIYGDPTRQRRILKKCLSTIERSQNMKKTIFSFVICLIPALAFAQAPAANGDPVAGKIKAVAICSGCHGVVGTQTAYPEVYKVPKIGGQNADYLVAALKAYRSGDRYNQTMKGLASALKESELVDIAAYYAQK